MIETLMKLFVGKKKLFEIMTHKVNTSKDIIKVVAEFETACKKHGFSILHSYVYHELLESKNYPIKRKLYIYEICQAKVAALVLTDEPSFSPFMPCRVAIYEEAQHVSVSTQNMGIIVDKLKDNKQLYKETSELFKTLKLLMNEII